MSGIDVSALEDSPRAQRVRAEDNLPGEIEGDIHRAGCRPADVARMLGIARRKLYEVFEGHRHMPAAWERLMPMAVQIERCKRWARSLGYMLRPTPEWDAEEHCDHTQVSQLVKELSDVYRTAAETHIDGYILAEQAEAELAEIDEAQAVLEKRKTRLLSAVGERGSRVISGNGRG